MKRPSQEGLARIRKLRKPERIFRQPSEFPQNVSEEFMRGSKDVSTPEDRAFLAKKGIEESITPEMNERVERAERELEAAREEIRKFFQAQLEGGLTDEQRQRIDIIIDAAEQLRKRLEAFKKREPGGLEYFRKAA